MSPLFLSYYTRDTPYEYEAEKLAKSLSKFSLDYHIEAIKSRGSWGRNCLFKAEFLKEQWQKTDRPLVWVDADARVMRKPVWFEQCQADIAFRRVLYMGRYWVCSGTVYLGRSARTGKLLDAWVQQCQSYEKAAPVEGLWDQISLQRAAESISSLCIETLPDEYMRICYEKRSAKDVIVHYQASNAYRQLIDDHTPLKKLPKVDSEMLYTLSRSQ